MRGGQENRESRAFMGFPFSRFRCIGHQLPSADTVNSSAGSLRPLQAHAGTPYPKLFADLFAAELFATQPSPPVDD